MDDILTFQGPVENVEGGVVLRIPLNAGGDQFVDCCRGIGVVDGDVLEIRLPEWLTGVLRIEGGDLVSVDNANGKFNIRSVNARSVH